MKKNKNLLVAIAVLVGIFLIVNLGGKTLTTISLDGSSSPSPYTCPNGVSYCEVQGQIDCNSLSSESQVVIFRTNAITSSDYKISGTWFALDEGLGLKGWTRASSINSASLCTDSRVPHVGKTITNEEIIRFNGVLHICTFDTRGAYAGAYAYKEEIAPIVDLTPTPTEPYKSNGQEIVQSTGADPFVCRGIFAILDEGNTEIYSEQIIYSSTISGSKLSSKQTISPNQKALIEGGDNSRIIWTTQQVIDECSKSECDPSGIGYYECFGGQLSTSITSCDQSLLETCEDTSTGAFCKSEPAIEEPPIEEEQPPVEEPTENLPPEPQDTLGDTNKLLLALLVLAVVTIIILIRKRK